MKFVILVGDGMGDEPMDELNGKTVLEAAATPAMDSLCRRGELLLTRTVPAGFPPGSDVANLSLLGYEPEKYYTGRAPLEAASMGIRLAADEIAYRCNLVTLEHRGDQVIMRDYSAGHITTEESRRLIRDLRRSCPDDNFRLYPGVSFRHLLVSGKKESGPVTTPPHDHLDQDVTGYYNNYLSAPGFRELITASEKLLANHPVNRARQRDGKNPANALWLWGEGRMPSMPPFSKRYGMEGGLISAVDLLKGIGVCCGLDICEVEGATGYLDTNYGGKVEAALAALDRRDFVLVHVEAPDEAGHQGSLADKLRAVEDFDRCIVGPVVAGLKKRYQPFRLLVTMDHYTPLAIRTHVDWPVPMLLFDSRGAGPACGLVYSERNAVEYSRHHNRRFDSGADYFSFFLEKRER